MNNPVNQVYGNRTRIRVCGLCWQGSKLLLVNHEMSPGKSFWAPPGGGVEFGQRMEDALVREFLEETHLTVQVGKFQFITEVIRPPLHAIEVFFEVTAEDLTLKLGSDPEMPSGTQIIKEVTFMEWADIQRIPKEEKHGLFSICQTPEDLQLLTGHYKI